MQDASDATPDQPRKRAAIGDGISAGSGSPFRDQSASPPPRRSKARPTSPLYVTASEAAGGGQDMFEPQRPPVIKKQLWSPEQDTPPPRTSFDLSNVAPQAQRSRAQAQAHRLPPKPKPFQTSSQMSSKQLNTQPNNQIPSAIFNSTSTHSPQGQPIEESYDIILQPETRPISQEQRSYFRSFSLISTLF